MTCRLLCAIILRTTISNSVRLFILYPNWIEIGCSVSYGSQLPLMLKFAAICLQDTVNSTERTKQLKKRRTVCLRKLCLSGILSFLFPLTFFLGPSDPLCHIFLQSFVAIPISYLVRSISLHFHGYFFMFYEYLNPVRTPDDWLRSVDHTTTTSAIKTYYDCVLPLKPLFFVIFLFLFVCQKSGATKMQEEQNKARRSFHQSGSRGMKKISPKNEESVEKS